MQTVKIMRLMFLSFKFSVTLFLKPERITLLVFLENLCSSAVERLTAQIYKTFGSLIWNFAAGFS